MLALEAEGNMFQWNEPKVRIPLAMRQIRSFLLAASARFCLRRRHMTARQAQVLLPCC